MSSGGGRDLSVSNGIIFCKNVLIRYVNDVSGLGVMTYVVVFVVLESSQFPSLAQMWRDTTKEGNVEVSPSQMLSSRAEMVA